MKINSVLSVGAALNDLLLRETDEFLSGLGNEKGGMTLVEKEHIDHIVKSSQETADSAPGGSACNTAVGLARLGAESHFLGKRGNDQPGEFIEQQLKTWGVIPKLRSSDVPTGQVMSIITPDAQRTMLTYLGAAASFSADEVKEEDFDGIDLVHLEGYLLFNGDLTDRVFELAKKKGCRVSLDLSSFEVVRIHRDTLEKRLRNDVDIIIANEDESKEFTGKDPEASLEEFRGMSELAIVKLGADGVLVAKGDEKVNVSGTPVNAVDTTGAGDLWASGFIYGLMQGWSLEQCCHLGNRKGSEVVQVVGAVIPDHVYEDIRKAL